MTAKGQTIVVQPDAGESYWQPVPANGYAEVKIAGSDLGDNRFATGVQVVAAGAHIRAHSHDANEEIMFFFEGEGRVEVDGASHDVEPGTTVFAGHNVEHKIINESDADLKVMWVLMPGGLENFFQAIGQPRAAGDPAPDNFPRPENVAEIERATVFGTADQEA